MSRVTVRFLSLADRIVNVAIIAVGLGLLVWALVNWRKTLSLWLETAVEFVLGTVGVFLFGLLMIAFILIAGVVVGIGWKAIERVTRRRQGHR